MFRSFQPVEQALSSVPARSDLLFVSGTFADVADRSAPAGRIERFGDPRKGGAMDFDGLMKAYLPGGDVSRKGSITAAGTLQSG